MRTSAQVRNLFCASERTLEADSAMCQMGLLFGCGLNGSTAVVCLTYVKPRTRADSSRPTLAR